MCDFHNFGLIFMGQCTVCLKGYNQRFWNLFERSGSEGANGVKKKFQTTTLILAFEANSALSHENENKIVKITHSASLP